MSSLTSCSSLPPAGSFRLYDHNHDGYITRQEMMDIVDAIYKMVGEMVIFSDEKDTPQQRVNQIFSTMDTVCLCVCMCDCDLVVSHSG